MVRSWHDLTRELEPVLDAYKGHVPPTYVFRGQPDSTWCLEPFLLRELGPLADPPAARNIEKLLESEFTAQSSLFPETEGIWLALATTDITERWAFMQHHG